MSGQLWLSQRASAPAPGDVGAYLLQRAWNLENSNSQWAEYSKDLDGDRVVLEVPQQAGAQDYPRAVGVLLDDLGRLEGRPPSALLRDIKASALDIVRVAIDSTLTKDGRIPIEAGRRVFEASRDLLLAAACSVIDPRPVFAKRKPDEAMKLLDRARFGQTEIGSFVLTMECSIAPRLQHSLLPDDSDPDAPIERRACMKLAQALSQAEVAVRESAASGRIDPFTTRTRAGVSANLCDAVAEMIEATSAETLTASFSFAARRPIAADVPRGVVFSSDMAPVLRAAAAGLRDEATYPETDVLGPVVKLNSADPSGGGDAVVHAPVGGKSLSIRLSLDPVNYQAAIEAHRDGVLIRCVGELAREGRSWVLRNTHDFAPVTDSEVA